MIRVFGNDIKSAYTGGVPVKEIYSYGVKVWPDESGPVIYDYLKGRVTPVDGNTPVPRIVLNIPYVSGGLVIRARINSYTTTASTDKMCVYRVNGIYSDDPDSKEEQTINAIYISRQGSSTYTIQDGFCRSNVGAKPIQFNTDYGLKLNATDDSYDSEIYVNGSLYVDPDPYDKSHNYNPSRLKIYLFSGAGYGPTIKGSPHKLYRFWIEDTNGNTLYDFVPAVLDGEAGLYEKINKTFHTKDNANASDFTVG